MTGTETPTSTTAPEPARTGRPTKYTPATARKICRRIAEGLPLKVAAAHAGISASTLLDWRRKFPDFDTAVEAALGKSIRHHLKVIETAANRGTWQAAAWLLEHRFPEHFARSRVELQHIGAIEHSFAIPLTVLDEIAAARRQHDEVRVDPEPA